MRVLLLLLALQIPLGLDRGLLAPPDNPVTSEKAALGRRLFDDTRLSADHSRACSDCHQPDRPRHPQPDLRPRLFLGWTNRHT